MFISLNDRSTIENLQIVAKINQLMEEVIKQITTGRLSVSGLLNFGWKQTNTRGSC